MPPKLKLSEYELKRIKNLEDNQVVLARLMEDLKHMEGAKMGKGKGAAAAKKLTPKSKRRQSDSSFVMRRNPHRSSKRFDPLTAPRMTRASSRRNSMSSTASSGSSSPESGTHLQVKFNFFGGKPQNFEIDRNFIDEDEEEYSPPRRARRQPDEPRVVPSVDEITDEDIENVAVSSGGKTYDQVHGTSCHQCRQKTIDQKTICRSEECIGVRGQFCGPCLRNRYGEIAKEVLRDPDWTCPPCRGICNCSICRNRNRKGATGILIHLANEMGFDNVHAYLMSLSGKGRSARDEDDD